MIDAKRAGRPAFEQVMKSAVVARWADLMRGGATEGVIHVEYGFASGGGLEFVRVWSSITRGHWLLACSYWMSPSPLHDAGAHFDNGYRSEGLAQTLDLVMQHQSAVGIPVDQGWTMFLQVTTPTADETKAAVVSIGGLQALINSGALPRA